ncbi:growth-regulating factor 3-like isoform X1 [Camellia sinensis]|uniref:growth-regulating factor 3-like isoform X1 n=1 Tax=Camellia sinensis TaxID=4442 RepID=UPI001035EA57|nr:growth-regulating factor 3-like isoform X1 [Camellia sinensis]
MDFNLKQWKYQQHESDLQQHQQPSGSHPELTSKLTHLSVFPPDSTTASRFPKMGSYFSLGQWQELELQALIFRHMLAGSCVPPQLLHLLNKTLLSPPPTPTPPSYYSLQHFPHYNPTLLQTGYWGRGGMDPEPGRCRRTDGKKWRCSRDVVTGHKYCERHMNRGRNRSRKPVEIPTPSSSTSTAGGGSSGGGGGVIKTNTAFAAQPRTSMGTGGTTHFNLAGPSPSIDLLHLNQRPSESKPENKLSLFETQNEVSGDGKSGGRVLRCFFDDWPRSLQQPSNAGTNASPVTSSTCLSISTPNNPPPSDFSLKLSTGNGDDRPGHQEVSVERERLQLNWAASWGTNPVAPMGGPLAEALRSSTASNSSPTSVLHQLQRGTMSETTSYVST